MKINCHDTHPYLTKRVYTPRLFLLFSTCPDALPIRLYVHSVVFSPSLLLIFCHSGHQHRVNLFQKPKYFFNIPNLQETVTLCPVQFRVKQISFLITSLRGTQQLSSIGISTTQLHFLLLRSPQSLYSHRPNATAYIYTLHTHFCSVADRVPVSVSKNNKTEREREREGKKQMSQSDKAAECKQQDMNYATRIQLQQVCEKTKEAIDTGTLALAKLTGCDFRLCP